MQKIYNYIYIFHFYTNNNLIHFTLPYNTLARFNNLSLILKGYQFSQVTEPLDISLGGSSLNFCQVHFPSSNIQMHYQWVWNSFVLFCFSHYVQPTHHQCNESMSFLVEGRGNQGLQELNYNIVAKKLMYPWGQSKGVLLALPAERTLFWIIFFNRYGEKDICQMDSYG